MCDEMEKYGVDVDADGKTKTAGEGPTRCPSCGGVVKYHGRIPRCENCGTEPFEKEVRQDG